MNRDCAEILTRVKRRCDRSDDEKLLILEEAAVEGVKIADVARRHDIKPQQIYGALRFGGQGR
ncbi:transposase [Rhizobium nepotum]